MRLRGKHKADYTPHVDMGDHIVVLNAEKVRVTGASSRDKIYYRHTGSIGGIKTKSLEKLWRSIPERAIEFAVKGMLPEEPAGPAACIKKLHVFAGGKHPHAAQQPKALDTVIHQDPPIAMPANTNYGTGRRKTATARVHLRPGKRQIIINDRPLDEFFGRETGRMIVRQPLELCRWSAGSTSRAGRRRRHHRPGRRDPPRHHARADRIRRGAAQAAARRRLRHARCARSRAQEGRSPQGPPRYAVLQALITLRRSTGFWGIV